jgi:hypothetical protein
MEESLLDYGVRGVGKEDDPDLEFEDKPGFLAWAKRSAKSERKKLLLLLFLCNMCLYINRANISVAIGK